MADTPEEMRMQRQMIDAMNNLTKQLSISATNIGDSADASAKISGRMLSDMDAARREMSAANIRGVKQMAASLKNMMAVSRRLAPDGTASTSVDSGQLNSAILSFGQNLSESNGVIRSMNSALGKVKTSSFLAAAVSSQLYADNMDKNSSNIVKAQRASALLTASQLEQAENIGNEARRLALRNSIEDSLGKDLTGVKRQLLSSFNVVDEQTGDLIENLTFDEMAQIRIKLAALSTSLQQAAEAAGKDNLQGLLAAVAPGAAQDDAARLNVESLGRALAEAGQLAIDDLYRDGVLVEGGLKTLSERIAELNGTVQTTSTTLDQQVAAQRKATQVLSNMTNDIKNNVIQKIIDMASASGIAANAMEAFRNLQVAFAQATEFNIAHIPATYLEVNKAALQMGMTFEETSGFLKENSRSLAQLGMAGFREQSKAMQANFAEFGFNMKQSAELVAPLVESAISSGVNTLDTTEMTRHQTAMLSSFKQIAAVTNVTAKQFIELNNDLFKSENVFKNLIGMDKTRRQAYNLELIQRRESLVLGGLDMQQAQEMIKLQETQKRASVKTKISDMGRLMIRGQAAGLGAQEVSELGRLSINSMRDKEQEARFQELTGRMNTGLEARRAAEGAATGGITFNTDLLVDNTGLSGAAQGIADLASQSKLAADASRNVTEAMKQLAIAAAEPNKNLTEASQFANQLDSLFTNPLVKSGIAASGAIIGLGLAATSSTARLLSMMQGLGNGGLGGPGRSGSRLGGLASSIGGILKSPKGAIGAGVAAIGGVAAGVGLGGAGGILGGAAQGALMGSMAGPLGAAIGGVIGAAAAALTSSSDKVSSAAAELTDETKDTGAAKKSVNNTIEDGTDITTSILSDILAAMQSAEEYLKEIAEKEMPDELSLKDTRSLSSPRIYSSGRYLTTK